jgi:hypothetical protein
MMSYLILGLCSGLGLETEALCIMNRYILDMSHPIVLCNSE